ncbi:MAG: PAS domain S-box protein [Candidatus Sumerlaeota bacterium]
MAEQQSGIEALQSRIRQLEEERNARSHELCVEGLMVMCDGFLLLDKRGRVQRANDAAIKMLGYSREEILNLPIAEIDCFEGQGQVKRRFSELQSQGSIRFETCHRHKDGHCVEVEVTASTCPDLDGRIMVFTRDISKRLRTEDDRKRLMAAIEQLTEIVMVTDAQARLEYVNPAFESITGYSASEVMGRNPRFLKSGEQSQEFYAEMWETLSSGSTWKGTMVNRARNGSFYTEEATISPVLDSDGHIVHYVAVKHNITHQLEIESQLRHTQRQDAIGQLTAGVAHDFNNLLQVINGHAGMILDMMNERSDWKINVEEIAHAGDRASRLVEQLLAFSRNRVLKSEDLDINTVISDFLKLLHRVIGENVILNFDPAPSPWMIHADRGMIEQVLVNLCVNARDAMPDGGQIVINTSNVKVSADFCKQHEEIQPGSYVVMRVSDNGQGMAQEVRESALQPFFTTKEPGKGTGLGLSTVYGIMRQHEGTLHIESTPGEGTDVACYWPVNSRGITSADEQREDTKPRHGNETILLAEDDPGVTRLARLMLERAGYRVLCATDGIEAVQLFHQHRDEIDLLLFDVVMPHKSGPAALEEIAEHAGGLPVIFASGYNEEIARKRIIAERGFQLVPKPFNSAALLSAVRTALDHAKR